MTDRSRSPPAIDRLHLNMSQQQSHSHARTTKKPPACDRCKAKRVLCHPNPAGCPRCMKKGIECTTTPVARRRTTKRAVPSAPLQSGASDPVVTGRTGSVLFSFPDRTNAQEAVSLPTRATLPTAAAQVEPVGFTSSLPFSAASTPLPSFFAAEQASTVSSSSSVAPEAVPCVPITPELAKHLFHCFEQTSFYDHILLRPIPLRSHIFEACDWNIDLLPPIQRVLAYSVCTMGALFSFHPDILGPPPPSTAHSCPFSTSASPEPALAGAPLPTSFAEVEKLASSSTATADLRFFGRRRAAQCAALRRKAEEMAKAVDLEREEPATVEGAAACLLLDAMQVPDAKSSKARPWLAAYIAHLREIVDDLVDSSSANVLADTRMWSIYLSADVVSDSYADQIALVGNNVPDPAKLEKDLRDVVDHFDREGVDRAMWPHIEPIAMLYLNTARELTDKILGTHARRNPSNLLPLSSFLTTLSHFRRIASSFCRVADSLLSQHEANLSLFPHASRRKKRNGTDGPRHTLTLALQGIRMFTIFVWTSLVLPFYGEVQRRKRFLEEREIECTYTAGSIAAGATQLPAGFEKTETDAFTRRHTCGQLSLLVSQARDFVRAGLEALSDGLDKSPHVKPMVTMRGMQAFGWAAVAVEEVESGAWPLDEGMCRLCERLSALLKTAGYVYSSSSIDALIFRLDYLAHLFHSNEGPRPPTDALHPLEEPTHINGDLHADFPFPSSGFDFTGLTAATPGAPGAVHSLSPLDTPNPFSVPDLPVPTLDHTAPSPAARSAVDTINGAAAVELGLSGWGVW
ncbi:hypothetical protein JCM8097_002977 [Rhodosporidiobolus ruineniae]